MIKTLPKSFLNFVLLIIILTPLLIEAKTNRNNFATTDKVFQTADTEAPTVPTNLVANEITASTLILSWDPSTDNVGVVSYDIYMGVNILIGNSTSTTFAVTSLASNSPYSFKIKAKDAAGNVSVQSVSVAIKTLDITPPTRPTKLTASGATTSTINLSWTASTDNDAVTAYDVFQGGNLFIGTSTTTNFIVTGLISDNTYTFTVRARDASGNTSDKSVAILTQTLDTQPPSKPTVLAAQEISQTTVKLAWTASTDNREVTSYEIYGNGNLLGTSTTPNFNASNLAANTTYSFTVKAKDADSNVSEESDPLSIKTVAIPPDYCVSKGFSSVLGMYITRVQIGSIDSNKTPAQVSTELKKGETYAITITANEYLSGQTQFGQRYAVWIDYNGDLDFYDPGELVWNHEVTNLCPVIGSFVVPDTAINGPTRIRITTQGSAVGIPYPCGDYTGTYNYGETEDYTVNIVNSVKDPNASIAPSNLKASDTNWSTTNLSWSAPDNSPDVVGYEVYKESVLVGTSETTNFLVTGLIQTTAYAFSVKAKKADGTLSSASAPLIVTTIKAPTPYAPTDLQVLGVTASKIDISWTPSKNVSGLELTYYIYLTYYPVNNSLAGKTKDPYFTIKGLGSYSNYEITVKAVDEMGNESFASKSVSASTPYPNPGALPPTDLTASEITTSSVKLSWTASKNDPPVTSYAIYDAYDVIGKVADGTTSFTVTGLKDDTDYTFKVRALMTDSYASTAAELSVKTVSLPKYCIPALSKTKRDHIANLDFGSLNRDSSYESGYYDHTIYIAKLTPGQESTVIIKVDRDPYMTPKSESNGIAIWIDLNGDKDFEDAGELVWSALYKNTNASDFEAIANFTLPTNALTGKTRIRIAMKENGIPGACEQFTYGQIKDYTVDIKKPVIDSEPPSTPANLTVSNTKAKSTDLSWSASTDNIGVATYEIYKNGILEAITSNTNYTLVNLKSETDYTFIVKAKDYSNNISSESNSVSIKTLVADITAPTVPLNLTASNTKQSTTSLSWTASTDNVGVTGYDIYKDGSLIGTTTSTTFNVSGLRQNSLYYFIIKAKDEAGNISEASTRLEVTTQGKDLTPPTTPTNLVATNTTKSGTTLSWTPSTDNMEVIGYNIYNGDYLFTTATTTPHTITTMIDETRYSLTVRAIDAAGNLSEASNNVIVDTLPEDQTPPTAPKNLTAVTNGITSVLSWEGSTDNVGVTGYEIYNENNLIATSTTTTYTIKYLTLGRDYLFKVKAKDRANNLSEASNILLVTTEKEILYCTGAVTNPDQQHINEVNLNTINNISKGGVGGYSDHTAISTDLTKGKNNTITIETYTSNAKSNVFAVWIDLNGDKDFEDEGELVWSSSLTTSTLVTGNFIIPNTAVNGLTRMRIAMKQDGIPTRCETFSSGEIEDYTVNIVSNLSVEDHNLNANNYILSPNPAYEKLFIKNPENKTIHYKISTITGQICKDGETNNSEIGVDVSQLSSGVYLIEMNDEDKSVVKKFIKK